MIRLLKETTWVEAYAGCGSLAGAREHDGKLYVPVVKERLQMLEYPQAPTLSGWIDVPTETIEAPFPPNG